MYSIRKLGAKAFRERFKSITIDNGPEFSDWRSLEKSCITGKTRTSTYYCHPYSAWERGTVEQVIGLIRRFIPKGSDIGKRTGTDIQAVAFRSKGTPPVNVKLFQMGFFSQRRENNQKRFGQAICS